MNTAERTELICRIDEYKAANGNRIMPDRRILDDCGKALAEEGEAVKALKLELGRSQVQIKELLLGYDKYYAYTVDADHKIADLQGKLKAYQSRIMSLTAKIGAMKRQYESRIRYMSEKGAEIGNETRTLERLDETIYRLLWIREPERKIMNTFWGVLKSKVIVKVRRDPHDDWVEVGEHTPGYCKDDFLVNPATLPVEKYDIVCYGKGLGYAWEGTWENFHKGYWQKCSPAVLMDGYPTTLFRRTCRPTSQRREE